MPSNTTNYNLTLYDRTGDTSEQFIDYRDDIAGTGSSNMVKIDTQMKVNADASEDLAGVGRTTETVIQNATDIASNDSEIQAIEDDILQNIKPNIKFYDASGTDTYSVTTDGTFQLVDGARISVNFVNPNTGDATLNIDGAGARDIKYFPSLQNVRTNQVKGYMHLVFGLAENAFLLYSNYNEAVSNAFRADADRYVGNTKEGIIANDSSLLNSNAVLSDDTVTQKIGGSSVGVTIASATSAFVGQDNINFDFSVFENGEASPDSDIVKLWVNFQNATLLNQASCFLAFSQDAVYAGANFKAYSFSTELQTGWNYLELPKSAFATSGGGAWDGIQSWRFQVVTTAATAFNFQGFQLSKTNPFQYNGIEEADITNNNAQTYIGPEYGVNVWKNLEVDAADIDTVIFKKTYDDFIAQAEISSGGSDDAGYLTAIIDVNNHIRAEVFNDELRINVVELGVTTTYSQPFNISTDDYIEFKLEKRGSELTLTAKLNNSNSPVVVRGTTTLNGLKLAIGYRNTAGNAYNRYASITELSHAATAGRADVADRIPIRYQNGAFIPEELQFGELGVDTSNDRLYLKYSNTQVIYFGGTVV